jgi:hypothetical protein
MTTNCIYKINKGINKPVEFKGLKAQYIWILGAGLVSLLLLFAFLYILGVNVIVCLLIVLILGASLFIVVYRMSERFGEHGMMKKLAARSIPKNIKSYSRNVFVKMSSDGKVNR